MDLFLKDKVAVVTGTSKPRGNGHAIAITLAEEGCSIACVDIDVEGAQSIAEEIKKMGRKSIAIKVDQGDPAVVKEAVAAIKKSLGSIDILVNNAAVPSLGRINKEQMVPWETVVNIDLSGPFYWMRETFDMMCEKKWGRIINISSMAGVLGGFGQCSYSASKGGLVSLTKTAALEGARYGITANAVSLGTIATDMYDLVDPAMKERLSVRSAMRRAGDPQDVGNIVAFLASDRANYITGANVIVDGGMDLFVY
jgi:3-oxoacyl-[acyl-carrier protein] reductase